MPGDFELAAPVEGELRRGPGSPLALDTTLPLANATFQVGDACNLEAAKLGAPFDAVLMANLICRVPDPVKAEGTPAEKALAFRQAYSAFLHRIRAFAALPMERLDRISLQRAVDDLAHLPRGDTE